MSLYSMQARGPASEKLAEVLAAECLAYWQVCFLLCDDGGGGDKIPQE